MAREERKKEDLFIKPQRRAKNFFVTSSAKMSEEKGINKTTISSSVFTKMSQSFSDGDYLLDDGVREINGSVLYMLQEMQHDIDDVYNEVSASSFQSSFFPFARIDSGSFGVISSSLLPGIDSKYDLGTSGKEWNNLYVDGTAYIDSLDLNGTDINTILNAKALKTHISGAFTSLSASIATDIGNAGGGTIDTALKNGSTNAVTNNAVFDGLALKLALAGGVMTGDIKMNQCVVRPQLVSVTSITNNAIDMRRASIFEIKQKSGNWSLITATANSTGQEITIIGLTTGVIRHSAKGAAFTFMFANGSNLLVSAGQAYKFVLDSNNIWRQIH